MSGYWNEYDRFDTDGANILFRSAKRVYLLGIHIPLAVLDVS